MKFVITEFDCNLKSFDQLPKFASYFLAVDQNFLKAKMTLIKLSINCQNPSVLFWQLIEFFDQLKSVKNFGQLIMKVSIN